MRALMLVLLLWSVSAVAAPPGPASLLQGYRDALDHQDSARLAAMVSPQAKIHVQLEQQGERMAFTLTTPEYLQQLRALWRFSNAGHYSLENIKWSPLDARRWRLTLQQNENYRLFGESIGQSSKVTMIAEQHDGSLLITDIDTVTTQW